MQMTLIVFVLLAIAYPLDGGAFCFEDAGRKSEISPMLLQTIAKHESCLNPNAINKNKNGSTDLGLMQINSYWIGPLNLDKDRLLGDPCYNVYVGAAILRHCINIHGYEWEAVGCYNASSKDKRINYSWKIFRQFKKDKKEQ